VCGRKIDPKVRVVIALAGLSTDPEDDLMDVYPYPFSCELRDTDERY